MPDYLAPGVYVEETAFRSKAVEPTPTGVTGFVGPTLTAPPPPEDPNEPDPPPLLTSAASFADHYGALPGPLTRAVQAFFDNGGKRLYVSPTPPPQDGGDPTEADYAAALARLELIPEIELVAAPSASAMAGGAIAAGALPHRIAQLLIDHAEGADRRRLAILDAPPNLSLAEVRAFRAHFDSRFAALYYPWVLMIDAEGATVAQPPSGLICGVCNRVDIERGVWKAPANETLRGVVGFQATVNKAQQEVLTPAGINALRDFRAENRGLRVWGARTLSSDPEYTYVAVRRLVSHIETALDRGLAWATFEPNGERLWANLTASAQDFLFNLWRDGGLTGTAPDEAYFVRCDRSTMSAADMAAGRAILLVGIAVTTPAEFMIFRLVWKTADAPD